MTRIDELFEQIWERPHDAELRLVLGDALLEAGDPRGELIQLQRQPHADQTRVMRLIQQHGLTWLGSLRGAVLPMSYELGFLAGCVAIDADAGGRIEWATVHTVELEVESIELLYYPQMRALRRVTGVQEEHLGQLRRGRWYPRELEVALPWERLPALLSYLERAPDLHALGSGTLWISRDERGRLGSLVATYAPELSPLLSALPGDCLTRLVVHDVPPAIRPHLEREARAAQHLLASVELLAAGAPAPPPGRRGRRRAR